MTFSQRTFWTPRPSRTPAPPAMTTPFTDYTVTEALLLFCLLFAFAAACVRILKGGFPWLR